jgi:hypothetical protein
MGLSNTTLFKQDFPNTTYTDPTIINAINLSTAILSNYCKRNFEKATYIEYLSGNGDNNLILPNYPVLKVTDISPDVYNGILITVDNTVYSCNFYSDQTSITFTVIDFDGEEVETVLLYSDFPRLSDLVTEINTIDNLTATLESTYDNEPSRKIKPDNGLIISGRQDYLCFYKADFDLKWIKEPSTDNVLRLNRQLTYGFENIYVKYSAGYVYPIEPPTSSDSSSSSSSSEEVVIETSTVPLDLTNLCNKLAYVLIGEGSDGIVGVGYKSERLGDYQYTKNDNSNSPVNQLLFEEKRILDRYIKKQLTW